MNNWLLLNQLYVTLDYKDSVLCVLEEVVSSEVQLVQVLASGRISSKTMSLVLPFEVGFNLIEQKGLHL